MIRLHWAATVADVDHWTPEHVDQADADTTTDGYDDWVHDQLAAAMHAAGNQFIAEHPDLFRGGLT
ncbi:hypothetical protein BDK92_7282 [Micromonospora pisi]|uniref:Uncharacterized protein n=1 Tax=Micromonospora pisi TaxID=589240 RepID=A0A495JUY0_9ACTN|nr:hypothetical protein [Micromonospora pisi]RKR92800.1 hypothetical protein BDK92_7282 [Micromonospora pisi]